MISVQKHFVFLTQQKKYLKQKQLILKTTKKQTIFSMKFT